MSAADPWTLLRNSDAMADAIAEVTQRPAPEVRQGLWREFLQPGSTVRRAARALGVRRHRFDDAMVRLYQSSDAFLYELALWNLNLLKRQMRVWVTRWITRVMGPEQRVLSWGDGLGFDALSLIEAGHDVTYFELPGYTSAFAERTLPPDRARIVTDLDELGRGRFDAVVCLDVLEHVPDVPAELARLRACLRPGGVLVVSAPFYLIHRSYVTHLRANRRYSGSLALFRNAGFRLHDAQPSWAPLMLVRDDGPGPRRPWLSPLRLALTIPLGLVLSVGRFTALPFELVHLVGRLTQPWYLDDMLGRGSPRSGKLGKP